MYNYFTPNEDELQDVIRGTLSGRDCLKGFQTIQTGWTNITLDVQGEVHDYIFRFPRNLFFARMMIKDCLFCNFLKGKVSLPIPDMKLKMSQNRPFSVHHKIKGQSLTSQMDKLTGRDREKVIDGMAQFLAELHAIPSDSMPADISESLGDFLQGLATVHRGDYDLAQHRPLRTMEQKMTKPTIVHGDFNPGNVLVDEGHVSGIIDFSFASISDGHADLGRFWGRSTPTWGQALVEAYQNKTQKICDLNKVQDVVDVFKYVEYKYVQYMQSQHPEITIPESVLKASALEARKYQQKMFLPSVGRVSCLEYQ